MKLSDIAKKPLDQMTEEELNELYGLAVQEEDEWIRFGSNVYEELQRRVKKN